MSELTPAARALLEDARPGYGPSTSARARMHDEILKRAVATDVHAGDAPPSQVRVTLKAHGGKLLGASLVAFAAATFAIVRAETSDPVVASTPVSVAETAPIEEPAAAPNEQLVSPHQLPEAPVITTAPIPAASAATLDTSGRKAEGLRGSATARPAAVADAPPAENPMPADSLGAEMRLVREARAALKTGNLALTRRNIDEHARTFPDGVLREERLVLGVLLLCAEGHVERARQAADELAASHPRSSHLDALRDSCAGPSTSGKPRSGN